MQLQAIETSHGIVERAADGLIHVRIRRGVRLNGIGWAEVIEARRALAVDGPAVVMAHMPSDIGFDLSILNVDHYKGKDAGAFTAALAIVTQDKFHLHLFGFYAACFRTSFPMRAFSREEEAYKWLLLKMKKVSA